MLYYTHMHFYIYIYILRSPYEGEHAGFFLGYLSHERRYKVHFFLALTHSCVWGWFAGQVHGNVFDSGSVKSIVKLHSFRMAVLRVDV